MASSSIAERTTKCLDIIRNHTVDEPASVILLIGRTGVGKSSLLEDITSTKGHAQNSIDPVTKQYQLEQATLKGKQFFFMDTPGFDEGSEVLLYNEIIRAIRDFDRRAQVTGILHISRINPARLEKWDAKLLVFLLAICGRHYLPRVTFVTTHWTAHHNQEKTAYNEHLRKLRAKWEDVTESVVNTYQHGRASADGAEDSEFLKWYEAREQIAFYAQVMICSRYGQGTLQNPQIVNELATGVDPLATMAAECLGISSSKPSSGTTNQTSGTGSTEHERGKADARTSERQSDNPQSGPSTNHQTQWQDSISPQTVETLGNLACKIGSSIFNSFFSGGGSLHGGVTSFPGSSSGFQWDSNSSVDTCKRFGLDSSLSGRTALGQRFGIGGEPGSAAFNNGLNSALKNFYG